MRKKKEKIEMDERWTRQEAKGNERALPYNLTFWHFLYPRHYLNMNKYSSDMKFSLNKKRNYCYLFFVATNNVWGRFFLYASEWERTIFVLRSAVWGRAEERFIFHRKTRKKSFFFGSSETRGANERQWLAHRTQKAKEFLKTLQNDKNENTRKRWMKIGKFFYALCIRLLCWLRLCVDGNSFIKEESKEKRWNK